MKKTWSIIGIVSLTACALSYPAYLLYKYVSQKGENPGNNEDEHTDRPRPKHLFASRKKHHPHHRHSETSGVNHRHA